MMQRIGDANSIEAGIAEIESVGIHLLIGNGFFAKRFCEDFGCVFVRINTDDLVIALQAFIQYMDETATTGRHVEDTPGGDG